ncbi:MAG: CPBP family intramembrane metalloprotease [Calditrichaeota bacterium]|nr:MAG: CPBP family intramembrane metalloprotease [Calditrichota bacterium]
MNNTEPKTTEWPPPKDVFFLLIITFGLLMVSPIVLDQLGILSMDSKWQLMLGECLIIVPALFYIRKKQLPAQVAFRLNKVQPPVLIISFAMAFPLTLLFEEINLIIEKFLPMPEEIVQLYKQFFTADTTSDWIFLLLIVVILAGVFEEMIFRGLLQQVLENALDITRAILATAFVFALMHGNPFAVVQIVFLGVIIGVLAWRSNSIWPAAVVHATNNLISIILVNTTEENLTFMEWHGHINPIFLIIAVALLYYLMKEFYRITE